MVQLAIKECANLPDAQHAEVWRLCRRMISPLTKGLDDDSFTRLPHGRPVLRSGEVCFSVSHSQNAVCCAVVCDRPRFSPRADEDILLLSFSCPENFDVGVDIELIRPIDLEMRQKIARRFFSPRERKYVNDDIDRFFEIYTAKESLCKLSGLGLSGFASADSFAKALTRHSRIVVFGGRRFAISVALAPATDKVPACREHMA